MVANVEYEVTVRDVEYAQVDGQSLQARIYQPQGTGPFPSLVDVHGGAWNSGDRLNNEGIAGGRARRGLEQRRPPEQ
jgi:acetyl esterase